MLKCLMKTGPLGFISMQSAKNAGFVIRGSCAGLTPKEIFWVVLQLVLDGNSEKSRTWL